MFVPRLEAPSRSDKYYLKRSLGGYNPCSIAMPNCTFYGVGRFMEIMQSTTVAFSDLNAGQYYGNTSDGYERGSTPALGAMICWSRAGAAGHVAIVEKINSDGSIVTSNSAYNSTWFYTETLYPPAYTWNSIYVLQGFIYNPAVSKLNSSKITGFIEEAKSHVGESVSKLTKNALRQTSTDFVMYCTKAIGGLLGIVIPDVSTPEDIAKVGVANSNGMFFARSILGVNSKGAPGDIMLIRTSEIRKYREKTDCDEVAIITDATDSNYEVVKVNKRFVVELTTYKSDSNQICGFYRPNWAIVQNSLYSSNGYAQLGKYYDTQNTSNDATIREVGYLVNNIPSTTSSNLKLSVVNYTTMLSAFLDDLLVPSAYSGNVQEEVITDGIKDQNVRIIVEYLINKGLSAASACGIVGNIIVDSGAKASYTDKTNINNMLFGICKWSGVRATGMMTMAGSDWLNNLTGQLNYLWYELEGKYSSVLTDLSAITNIWAGAKVATGVFARKFMNKDSDIEDREQATSNVWKQIVIQVSTTSGGSSSVVSGAGILSGTAIDIPDWVNQDGISNIYTNYSYWFSRWASSSVQRKIANLWAEKGRKSNRNIATIDGYYLIAVKPIFGTNGDKVSVVLKDGTVINAIIADIKGTENGTEGVARFGHTIGGSINVIEWEGVSTASSVYMSSSDQIDLTGWKGKAVKQIINGGSIL